MDALIGFAFLAGAAACLNPCGFALLPAYLAYFVGREDGSTGNVRAGIRAGGGMTVGVLGVFAALGGLLSAAGHALLRFVPLAAVGIGAAVAAAGVAMLVRPSFSVRLPVEEVLHRGRSESGFVLFGAAYGIASLGCTLPLFLVVVAQALAAGGPVEGLVVFTAYGLGMGAVLIGVSMAVVAGKGAVLRWARGWIPHLRTVGALGMVAAGGYLVYSQFALGALTPVPRP
ncbi:MAG: cytochrome c biogenesis protein CcdA [Armatimonadota bacterium]|nr:cytochrome c biogenesis protein CcdA [Armatimonadota bacterium]MDR7440489.1 cytochrome c biogenesis protein CcdA [Armatimonadota bacterium]MDR7443981.1 cytochrome c biogenesis protein CcdA [Armatimonadota bacterium]MDR7570079.1 cytochrome c biogenesis protein CcdA [Armatimonadota bacterium]MDR7615416.1 cytochrome c biogenesis protein CcdA [Armatimonadota bacterium]